MSALAERSMQLQMTIQEGEAWLAGGEARIEIERRWLIGSAELRR